MSLRSLAICILTGMLLGGCAGGSRLDQDQDKAMIAARANTQLGVEYLREKNYELAKTTLLKAIEQAPDYATAHDAIAILYSQVGDTEQAEKHYRRALKLNPDNADGHNNYGQFLCSIGRYDDAEEQFRTAAGNPYYKTPQIPLVNAGVCMASKKDAAAAEKYYRQALDKDPKFAPALFRMAELTFAAKDYLRTRAWLQRYEEVGTPTPESLWLGVQAEAALGDHQAWGNYALQLRSKFPESDQAKQLQEWEHERRAGH
jgi:type IV pilus assembly protein PilF